MVRFLIRIMVPVLMDTLRGPRRFLRNSGWVALAGMAALFCLLRLILRLEPDIDALNPWVLNIIYLIGFLISMGLGVYLIYGRKLNARKWSAPPAQRFINGFAVGFNSQTKELI